MAARGTSEAIVPGMISNASALVVCASELRASKLSADERVAAQVQTQRAYKLKPKPATSWRPRRAPPSKTTKPTFQALLIGDYLACCEVINEAPDRDAFNSLRNTIIQDDIQVYLNPPRGGLSRLRSTRAVAGALYWAPNVFQAVQSYTRRTAAQYLDTRLPLRLQPAAAVKEICQLVRERFPELPRYKGDWHSWPRRKRWND
ncbi:hypothetical protein AURDEDRAFT_159320 [Auricularia subglabra TFB-10046 SS5]|nr:hypothetical protein AURDEDRAFT_159320 [Auricularia subglabra TFB-10046 SS5]